MKDKRKEKLTGFSLGWTWDLRNREWFQIF